MYLNLVALLVNFTRENSSNLGGGSAGARILSTNSNSCRNKVPSHRLSCSGRPVLNNGEGGVLLCV